MKLGDIARSRLHILPLIAAFLALVSVPQESFAAAATQATESSAAAPAADAQSPNVADATAPAAEAAEGSTAQAAPDAGGYTPLGPEWIKGAPTPGGIDFQTQYTDDGEFAYGMHTYLLMPVITAVSLLVLALLLWVVVIGAGARTSWRRQSAPRPAGRTSPPTR